MTDLSELSALGARAFINIGAIGLGLMAFVSTESAVFKTYAGPRYYNARRMLVLVAIAVGATIHLLTLAVLSALAQRLGLLPL